MEIKLTKEKTDTGNYIYKIWKGHSLVDCYVEGHKDERDVDGNTQAKLQAEDMYTRVVKIAKEEKEQPTVLLSETI